MAEIWRDIRRKRIAQIEQVVKELKRTSGEFGEAIHLSWGWLEAKGGPKTPYDLSAQLHYKDREFGLVFYYWKDQEMINFWRLGTPLLPEVIIPMGDARHLFNVMNHCAPGVTLNTVPNVHADGQESEICIPGVSTILPVPAITGQGLEDALFRLRMSATLIEQSELGNYQRDPWEELTTAMRGQRQKSGAAKAEVPTTDAASMLMCCWPKRTT